VRYDFLSQCKIVRFHLDPGVVERSLVYIPSYSEPGFYRQVVSYSSFRGRELDRRFPAKDGYAYVTDDLALQRWCSLTDYSDFSIPNYGVVEDNSHLRVHETIWDLYDSIGYDHKMRKYVRRTAMEQACGITDTSIELITAWNCRQKAPKNKPA
jgi:hypothetical protein